MSVAQLVLFTPAEARRLTDEVKADAHALWSKLLRLYEGGAHTALDYSSWADYCRAEFEMGRDYSYKLLASARVVGTLSASTNVDSLPRSEGVARELAPLLEEPDAMREVWADAVEEHGSAPTAAEVADVRERRKLDVHFSSATDEWETPQDLFDVLDAEFQFELDVCALPSSAKCPRYFTPADDGLTQQWFGMCWLNPPYGDEIRQWIGKAYASAQAGATVVCLVPARVDTGWWWDYCRFGEIRFLRGRLRFGNAHSGAPFPSAVVVFGLPPRVVWWER